MGKASNSGKLEVSVQLIKERERERERDER
jgi:hypothetical protein